MLQQLYCFIGYTFDKSPQKIDEFWQIGRQTCIVPKYWDSIETKKRIGFVSLIFKYYQKLSKMGRRQGHQNFQQICGECFLALEQYKLKTNFVGCNMNKQEFDKFYNYYTGKSKLRFGTARRKIEQLTKSFEKNSLFLEALQLKTLNNMMRNYRHRMDLMANEPTDFNYAKFQKEEIELMEAVIYNDVQKLDTIEALLDKIEKTDSECQETLQARLKQRTNIIPRYERAFQIINHAEIRYSRYYQTFERSIANMINQLHSHLDKLSQFYTVWDNLGSSMMYKLRSDRQVLIEKTLEEKKSTSSYYCEESQENMKQILQVLPENSRIREYYRQKMEENTKEKKKEEAKLQQRKSILACQKGTPPNIRYNYHHITKVTWYENIVNERKVITFTPELLLNEKDNSFFKFTYEELHVETLEYIEDLKRKKLQNQFKPRLQEEMGDRYLCNDRRDKNKKNQVVQFKTYNVPPHMSFSCWFDRVGTKGYFTVQDFPMVLVQRKIEFQNDRQVQMQALDERRKLEYNLKQQQLDNIENGQQVNLGYKFLDSNKQFECYRKGFASSYDPQYLPKLKGKKIQKDDFSDSSQDRQKETAKQEETINKNKSKEINEKKKKQQAEKSQKRKVEVKEEQPQKMAMQNQIIKKQKPQKKRNKSLSMQTMEWLKFQQKEQEGEGSNMQTFVQSFIREYEESLRINKSPSDKDDEDDEENSLFKTEYLHLKNFSLDTIQKKVRKFGLDRITLVNSFFCVNIEHLQFGQIGKPEVRVEIVWIGQIDDSLTLKKNLAQFLDSVGVIKFKILKCALQTTNTQKGNTFMAGLLVHRCKLKIKQSSNKMIAELNLENEKVIEYIFKEGDEIYVQFKKYLLITRDINYDEEDI